MHSELRTAVEEKIVAQFKEYRHLRGKTHTIPKEFAQDSGNVGRESIRNTIRRVLGSSSTKYAPRFYFLFRLYAVVFFCCWRQLVSALYSNAIMSPLAAQAISSTDIRYVCGLKADTVKPPAVSSTKHTFYPVPGQGSFVSQRASGLRYILRELQCSRTLCISESTWAFLFAYSLIPGVPRPYDRHGPIKWFL